MDIKIYFVLLLSLFCMETISRNLVDRNDSPDNRVIRKYSSSIGTSINDSAFLTKMREVSLDVHNVFMIKHVLDDKEKEDNVFVVGTFIQFAFTGPPNNDTVEGSEQRISELSVEEPSTTLTSDRSIGNPLTPFSERPERLPDLAEIKFGYRLNDQATENDRFSFVEFRRSEAHKTIDNGRMDRHTFQVKAPLDIDVEFDAFPFKVVSANLTIEMSTFTDEDRTVRYRPNLMVHKTDKRIMFSIQKDYTKPRKEVSCFFPISKNAELIRKATKKIDKSNVYDFVSPFPHVTYLYDTEKSYCPKYMVTFLLIEDGMKKCIMIVFPLLMIAVMNHLNVLNGKNAPDAVEYLSNSATFALSVVVFLPSMITKSRFHSVVNANTAYIVTIFVALALSSFPVDVIEKADVIARIGMWMLWASFAFPIVNGIRFYLFLKRHKMPKTEHFMEDDAFPKAEKFKVTEDKVNDHFISIQKLADMNDGKLEGMGYKRSEERGKFKVIEFARGPAEGVVSDESYSC